MLSAARHDVLVPESCSKCALLDECGGLGDEAPSLWSCFQHCLTEGACQKHDWTCPCKGRVFTKRMQEAGGFRPEVSRPLCTPALELPPYVPVFTHGSMRRELYYASVVALPTFRVLGSGRGKYGPCADTGGELRQQFRVSARTRIILVSTSHEHSLERYWQKRNSCQIPRRLARLHLAGMTVPNYSYFKDAPRPHTIWSRSRLLTAANELSRAHVPVILHLNAMTAADWINWHALLNEHDGVAYVAKEFQTGNRGQKDGMAAIDKLAELQGRLGRALHPVGIGGAAFVEALAERFKRFTIVNATAFRKATERQAATLNANSRLSWTSAPTAPGEPLDSLLRRNVLACEASIHARIASVRGEPSGQLLLPLVCGGHAA